MTWKTKHGWAIVSRFSGLYHFSNSSTRIGAIALHVHFKTMPDEETPSMFASGKLDDLQRERWKRARKNGDRAVKIGIRWRAP